MADDERIAGSSKPADEKSNTLTGQAYAQPAEQIEADIGAVQGSAPDEDTGGSNGEALGPGGPKAETPPDSGEIEWARQVVKKPPHA